MFCCHVCDSSSTMRLPLLCSSERLRSQSSAHNQPPTSASTTPLLLVKAPAFFVLLVVLGLCIQKVAELVCPPGLCSERIRRQKGLWWIKVWPLMGTSALLPTAMQSPRPQFPPLGMGDNNIACLIGIGHLCKGIMRYLESPQSWVCVCMRTHGHVR